MHGDDLPSDGSRKHLTWFQRILDNAYECKHQWPGLGPKEEKLIRILNRAICRKEEGLTYEVDQSQAEVIMNQLQFAGARSASTPGTREGPTKCHNTGSEPLSVPEASRCRMIVARLNYLALDRPDIQHATKEACKHMARPHDHHWLLLKRAGGYIIDAPRVVQKYRWQTAINIAIGYGDSGWVGDQESRKSTSGGVCKAAPYVIKTWSSSQQVIALSSAEVERYALLECACQTLGVINLALDFGMQLSAIVHVDASAALAITQSQGLGKLHHISVQWLWFQEKVKEGIVATKELLGKLNPSDLFAKHLPAEEITNHLGTLDF